MGNYNRLKISIKLKNGQIYNFITEPDSQINTSWIYDILLNQVVVYNRNGARFSFPIMNIDYFGIPEECYDQKSLLVKKIKDKVFEVSDYVKDSK